MKKLITFLAGLLTIFGQAPVSAQQGTRAGNNSLLWRISGNQLSRPSYLFGTMHIICADDYVWTEKMKTSFAAADKICFEMDMDDPAVLTQVASGLMDKTGKKLEDYFTSAQFSLVKQFVKDSLGMDIALFQDMKPVALQTLMSTSGINCSNQVSYEDSLMKSAQKSNKEILGLENPAEQIEVLESIPTDTVIHDLIEMIQNAGNKNDTEYDQLVAAYKKQDIHQLYSLITASKDLGDMGIFLDGRNKKWIPRMSEKMQKSSVFFAVGAGHLWGDNGVITLLKKKGYTVVPVL